MLRLFRFQVLKDPRVESTQADLEAQFDFLIQIRDAITETYDGIKKIRDLKERIAKASEGADDAVGKAGKELAVKLTGIEHELITMAGRGHGFDYEMDDPLVEDALTTVLGFLDRVMS